MAISDNDILVELMSNCDKLEDYFLIGDDICAVNSNGALSSLLIEDIEGEAEGEMHFATVAFLRRIGARIYESYNEYERSRAQQ